MFCVIFPNVLSSTSYHNAITEILVLAAIIKGINIEDFQQTYHE